MLNSSVIRCSSSRASMSLPDENHPMASLVNQPSRSYTLQWTLSLAAAETLIVYRISRSFRPGNQFTRCVRHLIVSPHYGVVAISRPEDQANGPNDVPLT